jgi:hypothetical protein
MIFMLLNSVMAILFVFAVIAQFNDPDPVSWMLVYTVAAALCVATLLKLRIRPVLVAYMVVCATWVIYLSPRFVDTSMQAFTSVGMNSVIEEEVRELWGLVICLAWSVVLYVHTGNGKEDAESDA